MKSDVLQFLYSCRPKFTDTLIHWYIDTLIHWYIDILIHWYIDTLIHWYIDTLMQGCIFYFRVNARSPILSKYWREELNVFQHIRFLLLLVDVRIPMFTELLMQYGMMLFSQVRKSTYRFLQIKPVSYTICCGIFVRVNNARFYRA